MNLVIVYLSIYACFGRLCAHHQEKQLCFCDIWYLLVCVDDWYAGAYAPAYQSSTQTNKYQVSQKHSCFSWWWAHSHPKHAEIDKYTKNKFEHQIGFITRLYIDARSTKYKISNSLHILCDNRLQKYAAIFLFSFFWENAEHNHVSHAKLYLISGSVTKSNGSFGVTVVILWIFIFCICINERWRFEKFIFQSLVNLRHHNFWIATAEWQPLCELNFALIKLGNCCVASR